MGEVETDRGGIDDARAHSAFTALERRIPLDPDDDHRMPLAQRGRGVRAETTLRLDVVSEGLVPLAPLVAAVFVELLKHRGLGDLNTVHPLRFGVSGEPAGDVSKRHDAALVTDRRDEDGLSEI